MQKMRLLVLPPVVKLLLHPDSLSFTLYDIQPSMLVTTSPVAYLIGETELGGLALPQHKHSRWASYWLQQHGNGQNEF